MKTTVSRVRNTQTGQIFEVIPGSLLPDFFEEVRDEDIIVGEPKVDYEIEKPKTAEKAKTVKKTVKKTGKTKKGAKKDDSKKTK